MANNSGEHGTDQEVGWRSCRLSSKFFGSPNIWQLGGFTPAISSFTLSGPEWVICKNILKTKHLSSVQCTMYMNKPQVENLKLFVMANGLCCSKIAGPKPG
jgi:hypothetical protein